MPRPRKKRKKPDIQKRINGLKKQAEKLCRGKMFSWQSDRGELAPEIEEAFWERVVRFERASYTTPFDKLIESGVELPPPESLDDRQLADVLSKLVLGLAQMRTYLQRTDHLSDRDLYGTLYHDVLRREVADFEYDENAFSFLDILGGCSEEDLYLNLKYYASQEERNLWAGEFPEDEIPDHVDPPFDRDRHLPKPWWDTGSPAAPEVCWPQSDK